MFPVDPPLAVVAEQVRVACDVHRGHDRTGSQPEHTWLTILNNFSDPVALFDCKLRHVYVNEATARATNIPSERFRGKSMSDLGHPPEICDQINRNIEGVFESGEERGIELLFEGPDGPVHYECRMMPEWSDDDANVQYVIVISRPKRVAGG